jgi:Family of unknown function (DUF6252)
MIFMKTTIVYTVLILTAATLFSCRKEYSIENGSGLQADFTAQVNGVTWDAADSSQYATILQGTITVVGTSSDGRQLTISLNDTIVGAYTLNQQTTSVATFSNVDSPSLYAYATNEGSDTSQAGGTVNVISIDPVGKTISGIFSFKAYRPLDGTTKVFTSGVFYKIPYTDTVPVISKLDTLTASVNSVTWPGVGITVQSLGGELVISGAQSDGSNAITLLLPVSSQPGSYSLSNITLDNCQGIFNPTPTPSLASTSGNLNVVENDAVRSRIRGNFTFMASDPLGTGDTYTISNGYFSAYYGQ